MISALRCSKAKGTRLNPRGWVTNAMRTTTRALRSLGVAALFALGLAQRPALAQAPLQASARWNASVAITPWFQGSVDFSGGGFDARGAMVRAGVDGPVGGGHRAGLTLSYDYTEYGFSSPTFAPWTNVHHIGLAAPFLFLGANQWTFLVSPSVDYFLEDGADWSKTPAYGAVAAALKRFGPNLQLGLGLGAFSRLEETSVIPFPLVDWRITDRLRLANVLRAGPTGGAGLELSCQLAAGWTLGLGGAYRSARFRLREHGQFPNGIGEERAIPLFGHVSGRFGRILVLDVYAGALVGGELRVEDSGGNELHLRGYDPAPLLAAALSTRF